MSNSYLHIFAWVEFNIIISFSTPADAFLHISIIQLVFSSR